MGEDAVSARTAPPRAERMTARAWGLLLVLSGAIFLEGIDVSMMGVALPSIRAELGMSTSSLQWVVSAYVSATPASCCSAAAPPTCSAAAGCS
jgi:MFS family permease